MPRYRFTGRNHYYEGEQLSEGDIVELTEEQYEQWDYQFEKVEEEDQGSENDGAEESESAAESESSEDSDSSPSEEQESDEEESEGSEEDEELDDLLDLSVADLEEELESGDYDDRLDDLEIRERQKDDPRSTALDAINDRKVATED